jgi:hypothetical protein
VLDAILMEQQGVPAVAIVTTPFRKTAQAMAASWGAPDYAFLDCDHPIGNRPGPELDKIADGLADSIARIAGGT